jgi:hypothetical protein
MRKLFSRNFVLGLIVGILLASAVPAYGAVSSLIGKTVQGEYSVKVDDKEIAAKSIAIDGTTYAPLRAVAESIGYDVTFKDKTVIFSKSKSQESQETGGDNVQTDNSGTAQEYSPFEINDRINSLEARIKIVKNLVDGFDRAGRTDDEAESWRKELEGLESELKLWQERKAEYEANNQ